MTSKATQKNINYNKNTVDVVKLKEVLDGARKEAWRKSDFRKKTSFSPSVVGFGYGRCPRYWHYAFNGAVFDEKFKPQSAAAMDNGTLAHERIQKSYVQAEELDAEIEKEILNSDPPIRGFADVIVTVDGKRAVGDIKTIKSNGYLSRVLNMKPSDSHYLQVLLYMYIEGLDHGFLHYENKDTHEEVFMPILMTDRVREYVEYVLDWMRSTYAAHTEGLPKRPYEKHSVSCTYCPLSKRCWSDSEGTVDLPPLEVKKP